MRDTNFERSKNAHTDMHREKSHRQMLFMSFVKLNADIGITWEEFVNLGEEKRDKLVLSARITALQEV
jgi:hypothetical protein